MWLFWRHCAHTQEGEPVIDRWEFDLWWVGLKRRLRHKFDQESDLDDVELTDLASADSGRVYCPCMACCLCLA